MPTWLRVGLVLALLYLFLVGVRLLETGVKIVGADTSEGLFTGVTNPLAALFVGILATVLVQSSSVTTATIVALVAGGSLPVETAVPMIMGANIGTTVTNTIVALAHARRSEEFRLAFTAATMHDFFNILVVAILLPLELATGFLLETSTFLAERLFGTVGGGNFNSPIKGAVSWGADLIVSVFERLDLTGVALGVSLGLVGITLIFLALMAVTRNMKVLIASRIEASMNAALQRSGVTAMGVGAVITVAVQSSSITTAILIPLVASGLLAVRSAYPITLGANVGTTITALLAAFAAGTVDGLTIAFVHVLFNLTGILLFYPWGRTRYIPVNLAARMSNVAMRRRSFAVVYLALFIVVPAIGIVLL